MGRFARYHWVMVSPLPDASRFAQVAAHTFSHQAMACPWGITILGGTARVAGQAARAAFEEIDRLEQELSRFIPHSDVGRLNSQPAVEWLLLGPDCLDCLRIALRVHAQTCGAFDPTLGAAVDQHRAVADNQAPLRQTAVEQPAQDVPDQRSRGAAEIQAGYAGVAGRLEVDLASHRARRLAEQVHVDLGAVGKGYAVDCAAALLREWGVTSAAVHSGQSSVFALVADDALPAWRVALRDPDDPDRQHGHVELRNAALSGSAMRIRGRHIIDPRTGRPAEGLRAAWALAPTAAESDALSTAFMILPRENVRAAVAAGAGRRAWLLGERLDTEPTARSLT